MMVKITICPTCGSPRLKKVHRDWTGKVHGQTYTVPALTFYACPDCGERIYDRQAMRQIAEHSPAYAKSRPEKKSA
jgi:YgiT-type zinc finger domain-containing protein